AHIPAREGRRSSRWIRTGRLPCRAPERGFCPAPPASARLPSGTASIRPCPAKSRIPLQYPAPGPRTSRALPPARPWRWIPCSISLPGGTSGKIYLPDPLAASEGCTEARIEPGKEASVLLEDNTRIQTHAGTNTDPVIIKKESEGNVLELPPGASVSAG